MLCIALLTKLRIVTIRTYEGINIDMYFTKRYREDVLAFADTIIDSTNKFLIEKYCNVDRDLPLESQLSNLGFLRDKELINGEKFEQLKNQLLGRENKRSIGYR